MVNFIKINFIIPEYNLCKILRITSGLWRVNFLFVYIHFYNTMYENPREKNVYFYKNQV